MSGFSLEVMADEKFRNSLLNLVRENIKPAIEQVVDKLMPETVERIITKYLEGEVGEYPNKKARINIFVAQIRDSFRLAVAEEAKSVTDSIRAQVMERIESMVQVVIERRDITEGKIRVMIREELKAILQKA
jgi:uncharacterized membrane protein YheB (UPF0754 family)